MVLVKMPINLFLSDLISVLSLNFIYRSISPKLKNDCVSVYLLIRREYNWPVPPANKTGVDIP